MVVVMGSWCVSKSLVCGSQRVFQPVFWVCLRKRFLSSAHSFLLPWWLPWYNHTGWLGVKHQLTYSSLVCCAASPGQVLRQHQAPGHQAVAPAAAHRQVNHVGRAGGHQHATVGTAIIIMVTMTTMLATAIVTTIIIMITKWAIAIMITITKLTE